MKRAVVGLVMAKAILADEAARLSFATLDAAQRSNQTPDG
jgi:hypothetical protein